MVRSRRSSGVQLAFVLVTVLVLTAPVGVSNPYRGQSVLPASFARLGFSGGLSGSGTTRVVGGRVVDTLVLYNNTLEPGNFPTQNGLSPQSVAFDSINHLLYVADSGGGIVSVINTSTRSVVRTISDYGGPTGIAFDSANNHLYVADASGFFVVINATTNQVIRPLFFSGPVPFKVAVDTATNQFFLTNPGADTVSAYNTTTLSQVATIPVGASPYGIADDLLNERIFVSDSGDSNVTVIDPRTDTVVGSISVGSVQKGIAVDGRTGTVYVAAKDVEVINGTTDTVSASIPLAYAPLDLAVDSSTDDVYVSFQFVGGAPSNLVAVLDEENDSLVGYTAVGQRPMELAVDPGSGQVYVTNSVSDNLTVVNASDHLSIGSIEVASTPSYVAFDPSNGNLYVTNSDSDTVAVVNASSQEVVGSISVGSDPIGIAVDSANGRVYVADGGSVPPEVTVIDATTESVIGSVTVAGPATPMDIAVDEDNGDVYVTNSLSSSSASVSIINASTGTSTDFIATGGPTYGVAVDEANDRIFVACVGTGANGLLVVNGTTNTVVRTVPVAANTPALAVDPVKGLVYIGRGDPTGLTVVNATTLQSVTSVILGGWLPSPGGMAFDASRDLIYWAAGGVNMADGTTNTVVASIGVGSNPLGVAVDEASGRVFVTNYYDGSLSVIVPVYETTYSVNFSENGLPPLTNWSVTLNGTRLNSTGDSITFNETNGTYSYSVGSIPGFDASPSSGSLVLNGSGPQMLIVFAVRAGSTSPYDYYPLLGAVLAGTCIMVVFFVVSRGRRKGMPFALPLENPSHSKPPGSR